MPKPDITPGSPCWIDLMTSDTEKAKTFYTALFGWTYETGDQEKYGGYITASKDGRMVAGIMEKQADMGAMPDVWSTYLRTDDIKATTEAAAANGGQVFLEPMEVPEQGSMAMYGDAAGAAIGAWQFGEMKGYEIAAEAGAPAWHELLAKDYDSAVTFYQRVFGWDTEVMSDTPEFRYTTLAPVTTPRQASWTLPDSCRNRSPPQCGAFTSRWRTRMPPWSRPRPSVPRSCSPPRTHRSGVWPRCPTPRELFSRSFRTRGRPPNRPLSGSLSGPSLLTAGQPSIHPFVFS